MDTFCTRTGYGLPVYLSAAHDGEEALSSLQLVVQQQVGLALPRLACSLGAMRHKGAASLQQDKAVRPAGGGQAREMAGA